MNDPESWLPSKYEMKRGRLRAATRSPMLSPASILVADAVAQFYGRTLPLYARGRLGDLGCGRVPLYAAYKDHVSTVTCTDWGSSLHGSQHLDVACDLNQPLPFANSSFDTVILSDVLEHVAAPEELWSELARVTAPGGCVLLNVPFMYWLHEVPFDYYRFTEHALRRLATRASFSIEELEIIGSAPEVVADIFAKHIVRLPLVGTWTARSLQIGMVALHGLAGWRKLIAGTARSFPLGYGMVARRN